MRNDVGNLEPRDTYPDYPAPIVRLDEAGERVLTLARWGLSSPRNIQMEKTGRRADRLRAKGQTIEPPPSTECWSWSWSWSRTAGSPTFATLRAAMEALALTR